MLKVILITSFLSDRGGGIPSVLWGLSEAYKVAGVDCVVAGLKDNRSDIEAKHFSHNIIAAYGLGSFGYSRGLGYKTSKIIDNDSLVHSHGLWMHPGIVACRAARNASAPLVISAHGMLDAWALRNSKIKKRIAGWLFEKHNLCQAACLHALSESEANSYREYGLRNPICIIPNGIDIPPVHASEGQSKNSPWSDQLEAGKKVLLYLGRIHPKKGLANLLRAWAGICQSSWVLAIAGWDQAGHENELKMLCKELGIKFSDTNNTNGAPKPEASVLFLGPQFGNAKAACYSNCDCFILPSFSEGLPMVVLEAWAYGKPVIMTPECNLPEGFSANAAIRIEPNVESISNGLKALNDSPVGSIQQMGGNGRALVKDRFSWPQCAKDMISVYNWLLGNASKPSVVI